MNDLDVWTVSITLRTEQDQIRADAFLQGPATELECSARTGADGHAMTTGFREDLAAARVLETMSRRLVDRAVRAGACREPAEGTV